MCICFEVSEGTDLSGSLTTSANIWLSQPVGMGMKWKYHMIEWCRISVREQKFMLLTLSSFDDSILPGLRQPRMILSSPWFRLFFLIYIPVISFTSHIHWKNTLWVVGLRGSNHQRHPARTLHGQLGPSFASSHGTSDPLMDFRWWTAGVPQITLGEFCFRCSHGLRD